MERSTEVSQYKGNTISDLMLAVAFYENRSKGFSAWLKDVIKVAKEVFPYYLPITTRKDENVSLRMAVIYISHWKWSPAVSLKHLGAELALCLDRDKKIDHATILHNINEHKKRLSTRFSYEEYIVLFTTFRERLKEKNLL
jgi:hypothetical protein